MKRALILAACALVVVGCGLRGEVESRRFDLEWTVAVEGVPDDARSAVVWIAVPQARPEQRVSDLRVLTDYPWEWVFDEDFGNRMARVTVADPAESLRVRMAATVERFPVRAPVPQSLSHLENALYLREEAGVSLSPQVRAQAERLGDDHRARYDFVLKAREGDHAGAPLYFMTISRAAGVPAVFETGVLTRPEGETGLHGDHRGWIWYLRDGAWVPVDLSGAIRQPDRSDSLFGRLDADRIAFSRGREIRLPGMAGPPVDDLSSGAYAEVDGAPSDGVRRKLGYRPAATKQ